jgi:NAD(P)-dependent dehydrogenase (short-subunit alcohol dehydrogenase family)
MIEASKAMVETSQANLDAGLSGRRVLVTAGASGIGLAIVDRLLKHQARVAICDVSESAISTFSKAHPRAEAVRADVSNEAEVDALFAIVKNKLGGLDALINNAGIAGPTGAVEDIDPAEWRRCLEVGLTGQFLCARRAVPMLKATGGGSIVNMSSSAGRHGYAYRTPYSSAKFGVIGFTQSLAKELGPANIRVNALLPGIIEGPRMEGVIRDRARQVGVSYEAMEKTYLDRVSLRRMTSPHDVAAMIAFLLSDSAMNISGQSIGVDGNVETL